jgi:hypothetical protein
VTHNRDWEHSTGETMNAAIAGPQSCILSSLQHSSNFLLSFW